MSPVYVIERLEDATYLDGGGKVRQGFAVTFRIAEFDETHTVNMPSNNPVEIDKRIREEIARRQALAKLGG